MANRSFTTSLEIRAVDDDERVIEGIASTPTPDRMADVVEPLGAQFKLPLPLLLDHDHAQAIGAVEWAKVSAAGIRFRARIPRIAEPGEAKNLVDRAWAYAKHGLRRSVSIGFRPLETSRLESGGYRYAAWEWLELSLVAVPAQPDAEILATRAAGSRGHVAKLLAPIGRPTVVKLSPLEQEIGRSVVRRAASDTDRCHVAAITAEAKERRARLEKAHAELEARRWRMIR